MSEVVTLPPVRIVQGQEFFASYGYEDVNGAIDLTQWQVEAVISDRPFNDPFWRAEIGAGADGIIQVVIPPHDTAKFPAQPRIGGSASAVLQITLTAPFNEFSQAWQGPAIIAGVFK